MNRAILAAIALLLPSVGMADWQYAKFGMSPDEVVAASKGQAKAEESPEHRRSRDNVVLTKALVKANYSFKNFSFDVYFGLEPSDNKLQDVELSLKKGGGANCDDLLREARATYGTPNSASRSRFLTTLSWRSESTGNLVTFQAVGNDLCHLEYEPLPKPAQGGL